MTPAKYWVPTPAYVSRPPGALYFGLPNIWATDPESSTSGYVFPGYRLSSRPTYTFRNVVVYHSPSTGRPRGPAIWYRNFPLPGTLPARGSTSNRNPRWYSPFLTENVFRSRRWYGAARSVSNATVCSSSVRSSRTFFQVRVPSSRLG